MDSHRGGGNATRKCAVQALSRNRETAGDASGTRFSGDRYSPAESRHCPGIDLYHVGDQQEAVSELQTADRVMRRAESSPE